MSNSLEQLKNELEDNISKMQALKQREIELNKTKVKHREKINNRNSTNAKALAKRLVSLAISGGILFGGIGFGVHRAFKGTVYKTNIETYSSETGYEPTVEEYRRRLRDSNGNKAEDLTTLYIYAPWDKKPEESKYERTVRKIDMSDIDLEDLKAYLDLNLEGLGIEYNDYKQVGSAEDLYSEPVYEVIRKTQDVSDKKPGMITNDPEKLDNMSRLEAYIMTMVFILTLYGLVLFLCAFDSWLNCLDSDKAVGFISSIRKLIIQIKELESNKSDKEKIEKILAELKSIKEQMNELVQGNAKINDKYKKLMEKTESKRLLERYQTEISLIEEYCAQIEEGNKLALTLQC